MIYLDTHVAAWLYAGQATLNGSVLVTMDRTIRRHYGNAVW